MRAWNSITSFMYILESEGHIFQFAMRFSIIFHLMIDRIPYSQNYIHIGIQTSELRMTVSVFHTGAIRHFELAWLHWTSKRWLFRLMYVWTSGQTYRMEPVYILGIYGPTLFQASLQCPPPLRQCVMHLWASLGPGRPGEVSKYMFYLLLLLLPRPQRMYSDIHQLFYWNKSVKSKRECWAKMRTLGLATKIQPCPILSELFPSLPYLLWQPICYSMLPAQSLSDSMPLTLVLVDCWCGAGRTALGYD